MNFLYTLHSNRANTLCKVGLAHLDEISQEFRRGVISLDEMDQLIQEQEPLAASVDRAYDAQITAIEKQLAHLAFCKVRSLNKKRSRHKAHAEQLEQLQAHTTFEVDPICTESLLHNSQEAHAPPIKNSGADRVTPKPHLTHPHRSTLRGPSG